MITFSHKTSFVLRAIIWLLSIPVAGMWSILAISIHPTFLIVVVLTVMTFWQWLLSRGNYPIMIEFDPYNPHAGTGAY